MRKIKSIIMPVMMLFLAGIQGCSSFLDVDIPDTLVKKDYWKTKEQLNAALTGVYTQLGGNITNFLEWGDIRSDIYQVATRANASPAEKQLVAQYITTDNPLADWSGVYKGINWANSFIKNAETVLEYDQSISREEVLSMKAEVYALRALYYFYLVRTFQEVPLTLEAYESDTQSPFGPAVEADQVLDTIESDLSRALLNAPLAFNDPIKNYGRITQKAVKALWADVKLWRGGEDNYRGCIRLCEELEKEYEGKMLNPDTWFSTFSLGNTSESIFEYQFLEKGPASPLRSLFMRDGHLDINMSAYSKNMKKAYYSATLGINDTVRYKSATLFGIEVFKYTGISFDPNGLYQYRDDVSGRRVNFIFYRFREVLLMKAEALAMLGQFEEALKPINKIREATKLEQPTFGQYGRDKLFFDKLLAERVAELAFEGKQWFSMVRIALHTGYDDLLIDRITETTKTGIKVQTLRARLMEKEGWFMPYLKSEVENNTYLEQKEYYKGKE